MSKQRKCINPGYDSVAGRQNYLKQWPWRVFDHAPEGKQVSEHVLSLRQGKGRAVAYAFRFRTITAKSGCNISVLIAVYRLGLNEDYINELACCYDTPSLNTLIDLSIHLDNLLCDQRSKHPSCKSSLQSQLPPTPTLMQRLATVYVMFWDHAAWNLQIMCFRKREKASTLEWMNRRQYSAQNLAITITR